MRVLFSILFAVVALTYLTSGNAADAKKKPNSESSQSTSGPLDPTGKWPKYHIGEPRRYVIWADAAGYHVRTTTQPNHRSNFVGSITVKDGQFANIGGFQHLEKGKPKNIATADYGYWNAERNHLEFKFTTGGKEDAFDFTLTASATSVEFNLRVDNDSKAELIFIGKTGTHPPAATFALPAHP